MIHSFPSGGTHAKLALALTEGVITLHVSETVQNNSMNHVSIRLRSHSLLNPNYLPWKVACYYGPMKDMLYVGNE